MREPEMYRRTLEDLSEFFHGKRVLNVSEVAEYTGHCRRWVQKYIGVPADGITIMALANKLSKEFS